MLVFFHPHPNEIEEIYISKHLCYEEAKLKERESWKDNNVYKIVENQNQKCISLCWVCSVKQTDKESNYIKRHFKNIAMESQ